MNEKGYRLARYFEDEYTSVYEYKHHTDTFLVAYTKRNRYVFFKSDVPGRDLYYKYPKIEEEKLLQDIRKHNKANELVKLFKQESPELVSIIRRSEIMHQRNNSSPVFQGLFN